MGREAETKLIAHRLGLVANRPEFIAHSSSWWHQTVNPVHDRRHLDEIAGLVPISGRLRNALHGTYKARSIGNAAPHGAKVHLMAQSHTE